MRYSSERREAVLKKRLPPENKALKALAREEGTSEATLYIWRRKARSEDRLLPDGDTTPEDWSAQDKFGAVVETASMNETELAEYCRRRGPYPEQVKVKAWRAACEQATDWECAAAERRSQALREERKRAKALERELPCKKKARAETAALLNLRKKPRRSGGGRRE